MEDLLPYCKTDTQREVIKAIQEAGNQAEACEALGKAQSSVSEVYNRVKKVALKQGYSVDGDLTNPVEEGMSWLGTSTLLDFRENPKGDKLLQWVKTSPEKEKMEEAFVAALEALKEDIPKAPPVLKPNGTNEHLLAQYTITDYHLGALAWEEETGDAWDTDIAEKLLLDWFSEAIRSAPPAKKAILANIADFMHYDGLDSVTPLHKHVLDSDTRFQKIVRVAIKTLRTVVQMLLEKHEEVHIIMAEGNHDLASSVWLREMFTTLYEEEPRVTVDRSPDVYYCVEHGEVSLFFHHGHKKPMKSIDNVLVSKFRDVFGRTKFSYAHMGHLHHDRVLESNLMTVEQHRTLAGRDSYASRGGWISDRSAKVIIYDDRYGEVGRITLTPEMVTRQEVV